MWKWIRVDFQYSAMEQKHTSEDERLQFIELVCRFPHSTKKVHYVVVSNSGYREVQGGPFIWTLIKWE